MLFSGKSRLSHLHWIGLLKEATFERSCILFLRHSVKLHLISGSPKSCFNVGLSASVSISDFNQGL